MDRNPSDSNAPGKDPLRVLRAWKTFAELPPTAPARRGIEEFLAAAAPEKRRAILARVNPLFGLQRAYQELGILRDDPGERVREFDALLAMGAGEIAAALGAESTASFFGLLQNVFEFGRGAPAPKHVATRLFLAELWELGAGGTPMKYCLFPGGLLYSAHGKTHEETARDFVGHGFGGGVPQSGGLIIRVEKLEFQFDVSSTAFRAAGNQPAAITEAFRRWTHLTGADEDKVKFLYLPAEGRH